jgi:hypothetical protein
LRTSCLEAASWEGLTGAVYAGWGGFWWSLYVVVWYINYWSFHKSHLAKG